MCNHCGYNPCQCNPTHGYNWYNTEGYPCTPCTTTPVCKKKIPAKCTYYNGPNLTQLGLTTNIDIEAILATVNSVVGSLQTSISTIEDDESVANLAILAILNDINSRIIAITGISHAPYTL